MRGQTCALTGICDCDLEINPMTLKLKGDRDILKMYPHTDNEAASIRHSRLGEFELKRPVVFDLHATAFSLL